MPRWFLPVLVVAVVGLVLSVVGLLTISSRQQAEQGQALKQDDITAGLLIPEFSLTDSTKTPRTQQMLEGEVTVLAFVFTNCPFACPMMGAAMSDLQTRLADTRVRFLSISVDPTRDTPERLAEYARAHGAKPERWSFLTGEIAQVNTILEKALGFKLQQDEANQITLNDGTTMANIVHPTKLLLIGPDRKVLAFFESAIPTDLDALARRARAAAAALPK